MRYTSLRSMDISNGNYIGCALFTQGCSIHCKNCFSKQTWDFNGGLEWTDKEESILFDALSKSYIKRFSILGGEPLDQARDLYVLLKKVKTKFPDKIIWIYSGRTFEDNIKDQDKKNCVELCDIMVDGPFIDDLKDFNLHYRGSSNQRIIDIQKSIKEKRIIEIKDI